MVTSSQEETSVSDNQPSMKRVNQLNITAVPPQSMFFPSRDQEIKTLEQNETTVLDHRNAIIEPALRCRSAVSGGQEYNGILVNESNQTTINENISSPVVTTACGHRCPTNESTSQYGRSVSDSQEYNTTVEVNKSNQTTELTNDDASSPVQYNQEMVTVMTTNEPSLNEKAIVPNEQNTTINESNHVNKSLNFTAMGFNFIYCSQVALNSIHGFTFQRSDLENHINCMRRK